MRQNSVFEKVMVQGHTNEGYRNLKARIRLSLPSSSAGGNPIGITGGYVLPAPAGELAGAASAGPPLIALERESNARKLAIQELCEDPYGENGDEFKKYNRGEGPSSIAKRALRKLWF
jgi:hypothetical protein